MDIFFLQTYDIWLKMYWCNHNQIKISFKAVEYIDE